MSGWKKPVTFNLYFASASGVKSTTSSSPLGLNSDTLSKLSWFFSSDFGMPEKSFVLIPLRVNVTSPGLTSSSPSFVKVISMGKLSVSKIENTPLSSTPNGSNCATMPCVPPTKTVSGAGVSLLSEPVQAEINRSAIVNDRITFFIVYRNGVVFLNVAIASGTRRGALKWDFASQSHDKNSR